MKKVLITGAFGFIGLNLLNQLLLDGVEKIYVIDSYLPTELDESRIVVLSKDLADFSKVGDLVDIDAVVLLAGISGKQADEDSFIEVNVNMNMALINKVVENNPDAHIIIPSSQLVYEDASSTVETLDLKPKSVYARSKLELERMLLNGKSGLLATSFRMSNPFGPHIPHPQNYNYANQMLFKLFSGEMIELYNLGRLEKNYVPIQNVCKIISETISKRLFLNQIVNLGHFESIKMVEFFELARKVFGKGELKMVEKSVESQPVKIDVSTLYETVLKESMISLEESLIRFKDFHTKYNSEVLPADVINT